MSRLISDYNSPPLQLKKGLRRSKLNFRKF